MDVPDRAEQEPEPISVERCRELLGDDADTLSDEEILVVARHAEALAHVVIALALQDGRIH
jgi:rRNA maturation endonuclease Nob1